MALSFSSLGIPRKITCFFALTDEPIFNYGDAEESFNEKGYRVPPTRNIWVGGNRMATTLIIVHSVIEAIAMLSVNFQRFDNLDNLAVVATGTMIYGEQMDWVRKMFPGRKFILAFGNDLAARLTDIKVAAWLQQHRLRVDYRDQVVAVSRNGTTHYFDAELLCLASYKRAFGVRNNIRTIKPKHYNTFLEQIRYDAP